MSDLIGKPVISWNHNRPVEYGGPSERPGMESTAYSLRHGGLPVLRCDPARVAPADTPIPEKDDRVVIVKHPRKPEHVTYAPGLWELRLPGQPSSWHKTKRDATAEGLRRLAILDHHAAVSA